MVPNKINFYSLEDLAKFILTKVALGLVTNVNCTIAKNNKVLFRLMLDQCYVFSMNHVGITAILDDRALSPLLFKNDDIDYTRNMLINLFETISEILKDDIFNSPLMIECIYNDTVNIEYNIKTKQSIDLNKQKEMYCSVAERLLQNRSVLDRYDENNNSEDDDEEWYV